MLQEKCKAHKSRANDLASEVASLRIGLHEKEAEVKALTRVQQQQRGGCPGLIGPGLSPGKGEGLAGAGGLGQGFGVASPTKAGLAAALASIRQRQEAYLGAL